MTIARLSTCPRLLWCLLLHLLFSLHLEFSFGLGFVYNSSSRTVHAMVYGIATMVNIAHNLRQ